MRPNARLFAAAVVAYLMFDRLGVCQAPPPTVIKAGFVNQLDLQSHSKSLFHIYTLYLSFMAMLVGGGGSSQLNTIRILANYQVSKFPS